MTTAVKELSEKAREVIDAIVTNADKKPNAASVAEYLGVSVATVTGALGTLKKRGFVTVEDGVLVPTAEANFEFGATPAAIKTEVVTGSAAEITAAEITEGTATDIELEPAPGIVEGTATEVIEGTASEVIEGETVDSTTTEVTTGSTTEGIGAASGTKAERARAAFEELKTAPRKVLMARLMSDEIGLSKNGANTYIYNMRKKAGMVTPRTTEAVATTETTAEASAETVETAEVAEDTAAE